MLDDRSWLGTAFRVQHGLLAAVSVVALGCSGAPAAGPVAGGPPSVVLVVIDTLRADRLGSDGGDPSLTPQLDRLARDGVLYERAYAQSSWTKTSIASLLTGVFPHRHRVFVEGGGPGGVLPAAAVTLAERLRDLGYRTVAVSGNPHIRPEFGFDQGFDRFESTSDWGLNNTAAVSQQVRELLRSGSLHPPFFLYVHFLDPHDPYVATRGCRPAAGGIDDPRVLGGQAFALSGEAAIPHQELQAGVAPVPEPLAPGALSYLQRLYDCEIQAVDAAVGELLAELPPAPAWIVVTSDHGEEFLEHGRLRHGYALFDETVRVPLLVRPPGGRRTGLRVGQVVQLVDVVPTLLAELGVTGGGELDGLALPPFAPPTDRATAGPTRRPGFGVTRYRSQDQAFLVAGDRKLIVDFAAGSLWLYDLADDPGEHRPLDGGPARDLVATVRRLIASSAERALDGGAEGPEEISPELAAALRSLGYVAD